MAPYHGTRALLALALLGHLAGALGLPLPCASADGSHPCAGRQCGCSADVRATGQCCCSPAAAAARPARSCCSSDEDLGSCCTATKSAGGWTVSFAARQCRGDERPGVLTLPFSLPAVASTAWRVAQPPGLLSPATAAHSLHPMTRPPTPPPRG